MERRTARIGAQRAETVMPSAAERSGAAAAARRQTEQQVVGSWILREPLRPCPDTNKLRLTGFVVAERCASIVHPL
eukprot:COSAG06_NODE_1639_length_8832_cov_33.453515_4_plen_76_part_00